MGRLRQIYDRYFCTAIVGRNRATAVATWVCLLQANLERNLDEPFGDQRSVWVDKLAGFVLDRLLSLAVVNEVNVVPQSFVGIEACFVFPECCAEWCRTLYTYSPCAGLAECMLADTPGVRAVHVSAIFAEVFSGLIWFSRFFVAEDFLGARNAEKVIVAVSLVAFILPARTVNLITTTGKEVDGATNKLSDLLLLGYILFVFFPPCDIGPIVYTSKYICKIMHAWSFV